MSLHTVKIRHYLKENKMPALAATRKSEISANGVLAQLEAAVQSAPCLSVAMNKSADVNDNAQLLVYVRFLTKIWLLAV